MTLHLPCVYFKHRKVTICPAIAELRLPAPRPPPHWERFLFVWLDFQLCEKCVLQREEESGWKKGSWAHGWLISHVLDIKGLITVLKALCLPLRKALLGIFYCLPWNYSSLTSSIDIIIITNVIAALIAPANVSLSQRKSIMLNLWTSIRKQDAGYRRAVFL